VRGLVYGFIEGRDGCRGMRALAIGVCLKADGWERGFEFMRSAGREGSMGKCACEAWRYF